MKENTDTPQIVLNPETSLVLSANTLACDYYGLTPQQLIGHELNTLGHVDLLTQLPNRQLFLDRLSQAVTEAYRNHQNLALIFIDLDRFKPINDSLGHVAGDEVLVAVAKRIKSCIREADTLARLGGDEFVVLLKLGAETSLRTGVEMVAQKILAELIRPFNITQTTIEIGGSLGISRYPQDATTGHELLQKADLAMYRAKNNGRNQWCFFKKEMDMEAQFYHRVEQATRIALDEALFAFYFEPILYTQNQGVFALEAKLDWQASSPDSAVQIEAVLEFAQTVHLGIELNQWMICHALDLLTQYSFEALEWHIIVPLMPIHFRQKNLVTWLDHELAQRDIEPACLMLSISPACLQIESLDVAQRIEALTQLGVQIMMDDFGYEGSSLFKMAQFDLAAIKLMDFNLSKALSSLDRKSEKLAAAIIAFAKALNPVVIGSGIVSQEQQSFMLAQHCDYLQGYGIATRFAEADLEAYMVQRQNPYCPFEEEEER